MKLQTQIALTPERDQIDYGSRVLLLGSCFAENMGAKLEYYKFQNLQNPFGIIFNPVSVQTLLERVVENRAFTSDSIFEHNELWQSFEVHSSLSTSGKEEFLQLLNDRLEEFRAFLMHASHVVLTFGTAWVYRHKETDAIVANCHKLPQREFSKELLSVDAVAISVEKIKTILMELNPGATIIGTVSPVRHLKDGFTENARSKAHLLTALLGLNGIHYFPAYEMMMDELRDYRFYEPDLVHPNATAIEIIWDRFKGVWIASETEALQKQIDTIQRGLQHRPFHPESSSFEAFQQDLQKKIEAIQEQLPHINFS